MLVARHELAADPLVARWTDHGRPLVVRRVAHGDAPGLPLGLPLPPSAGKRRLSFVVQPADVMSVDLPPTLRTVGRTAPCAWWPTFDLLESLADRYRIELRVCGSLAWSALTGLDYLTDRSDLDLLLYVNGGTDLGGVTASLAAMELAAPMRFDGELIREDGAAVSWREFHGGAPSVLLKTLGGISMIEPGRFAAGDLPS